MFHVQSAQPAETPDKSKQQSRTKDLTKKQHKEAALFTQTKNKNSRILPQETRINYAINPHNLQSISFTLPSKSIIPSPILTPQPRT